MSDKKLKDNLNSGNMINPLDMLQGVNLKALDKGEKVQENKGTDKIELEEQKKEPNKVPKPEIKKKKSLKANETGVFFQTSDDMKFKIEEFQLKLRRKVTGKKAVPVKLIMHAALEIIMDDFERNGVNSRFFDIIENELANE